jgi:hypothetical protein
MDNRATEAHAEILEERRKKTRMRALKSARIVFNNRCSVLDCTVRNLSEIGCCLRFGDLIGVPDSFDLEIGATKHRCQVIWRKDNRVGVQFA